ncbi:MAG: DedA family protein [Candidatus Portnoybacteria bacterium]|nr:DedA family protein [Candidatus Portnoybacteria bacterium]
MITIVLSWLASLIISVISGTGYFGVFVLMALESACIPVPSEVIMPFSGFLVWRGKFILWQVVLWGALGNLIGSIIAYCIGFYGGRPFVEKYGKYFLISRRDLNLADRWFLKHGQGTVFFSRLLPVVRTFISLPAGVARMDFKKFCFYTFIGCLPWSYFLAYAGLTAGENWENLRIYFDKFNYLIIGLIILGIVWWTWRHVRHSSD